MARSIVEAEAQSRDESRRVVGSKVAFDPGRLAPPAILLLAFAIRLYHLGADSLWYDETYSAYVSGLDLVSLTRHTAGDIHPPLYYYMLHFWMDLTGKSEFVLGFLSLFFGMLLLAAVYRMALRLFDRSVAVVSALLVAVSPFHIWYSQEVRMYTMAALLTLAATWFALEAIDGEGAERGRLWPLAGYAISSALGLYVLYYAAFALIFLNLFVAPWWILDSRRRLGRAFIGKWALAQAGIVALYLPWLPTAIRQAVSPAVPPWRHFVALWDVIRESWSALSLGQSSDPTETWPFLLLFVSIYALGLLAAWKLRGRFHALILAGAVWGPVLIIFLISLITPLFFVRYVFVYSPLFYITVSLGLVFVARHALAFGLLNLLVVLGALATSAQAYFHSDTYAPDDFRNAVRYLQEGWRPGDAVLIDAGYIYPAFLYYYRGELGWRGRLSDYPSIAKSELEGPVVVQLGSIDGDPGLGWGDPKADFYRTTKEEVAKDLEVVSDRHRRLWLLRGYDTVTDPEGFVRSWLEENATLTDDIVVQGSSNVRVQSYLLGKGRGTKPVGPPVVNFDNAIAISSVTTTPPLVKSGETVFVSFEWLRQMGFEKDVRAYLALIDESGRFWQQQDSLPVGRLYPSSKWPAGIALPDIWQIKVPTGTPPGSYKLVIGTYVASSGQTLEVRTVDGKSLGPQASLGNLTIEANPDVTLPSHLSGVKADFGGELALVDFALGTRRVKPGESLHLDLFWKALSTPKDSYIPILSLRDGKGGSVSRQEGSPVDGRYPTSGWQKGEVVWDQRDLAIDAEVPDGDFTLHLSLDGKDFSLGTVKVRGRPHEYEVPKDIANPLSMRLGDSVELLGYDVEPRSSQSGVLASVGPGQMLRVVLYWRALERMETSYTVFTQLLDSSNHIQGQRDRPPGDGALPTSGWLAGEVTVDAYEVEVKPGAGPGDHLLIVGMYDPKTGQRLPIFAAEGRPIGDALPLGKVSIEKGGLQ